MQVQQTSCIFQGERFSKQFLMESGGGAILRVRLFRRIKVSFTKIIYLYSFVKPQNKKEILSGVSKYGIEFRHNKSYYFIREGDIESLNFCM